MAAMNVPGFQDQLWGNGPSPGAVYNFPGIQMVLKLLSKFHQQRELCKYPTTTGTSVLGIKFDGGVLMAADTLGSYGSLARFREVSRLTAVGNNTVVGGSGDYADFQYLKSVLEQKVIDDACLNDGHGYTPKSIYSWLTRVMYYRRTRFDPLWNQVVVGGVHNGESFLGCVDKIGIAFEAPTISTGFGAYLAQPILRDALEKNPSMPLDQARQVITRCLQVLFYRDARSLNKSKKHLHGVSRVISRVMKNVLVKWNRQVTQQTLETEDSVPAGQQC
ncbi:Proteasome subunit beta type-4 [Desmophyllum pertusum]|uniref:Proteasome subunit beta n=1 Tax=Desmophyllum pertusum TaxID=174260 RepID=A0A9X0A697_9CNID|nr:Proteasome subunit beta type-4 [Desmophyllum pertusum]